MEHEQLLQRTAHVLMRRASWVRRRMLLLNALFIGLCCCLALAVWDRFMPFPTNRLIGIGLGIMALSAVVAVLLSLRSRPDPLGLLIRADRALRLKERLSTA